MMQIIVTNAVEVTAALLMMLIGVVGTWLTLKLSKRTELGNLTEATAQVTEAAQTTVGELKQELVDGWKAAGGGKLTQEQIAELKSMLLKKTYQKLSEPTVALLTAARVDVSALIAGAGEDWINHLKEKEKQKTAA